MILGFVEGITPLAPTCQAVPLIPLVTVKPLS